MLKTYLNLLFLLAFLTAPVWAQKEKAEASFNLGVQAINANNYDEAITHFTACIEAMPLGPGSCYHNRAVALLGKSKAKPKGLVDPLAGNTDKLLSLKIGGVSEVKDELRVRALADVNKVLQMAPKSAATYYLRADIYSAESMDEQAINDYRAGIAVDAAPETRKLRLAEMEKTAAIRIGMRAGAIRMRALGLQEMGEKAKAAAVNRDAVEVYTQALALDKTNSLNLRSRARTFKDLADYTAAIADYTEAIRVDPADAESLTERAEVYLLQNKKDLALADYERAMAVPQTGMNKYYVLAGRIGRGKVLLDAGRIDEAVADFTKALSDIPDYAQAAFYRGLAYAKNNNKALAVADFRLALEISPDYKEAKDALAKLGPVEIPKPAIAAVAPTVTTALTAEQYGERGMREADAKDYSGAIKSFTECLRLKPDHQGCLAFRGAIYGLRGNSAAAAADFEKAIQVNPSVPDVYLVRGTMYMELRQRELAIADFRTALKLAPNNLRVRQSLERMGVKP